MTISAAVLEAMAKAGCSAEQIVAAIRADELQEKERLAAKREKTRIRVQKHRARNASNALQEDVTRYTPAPSDGLPPGPPNPLTPPPPIRPLKGAHIPPTPKAELASVLDDQHVSAVIDHRQRIRKPLTAHAAKLLAGKFAQCPDPNAAADAMVANGWTGFEPGWMEDRQRGTGPPGRPREPTLADYFDEQAKRLQDADNARTITTDYRHGPVERSSEAVSLFAAAKREPR